MDGMDGDPEIPKVAVEEDPLVAITGGAAPGEVGLGQRKRGTLIGLGYDTM